MEHYLAHTDYPIWEVIQNGNGPVSISTDTQGQIKVLPPRTAEEILARERERKARTTLLMALPEDHLAITKKRLMLKSLWDLLKSRFGGNDESKKMQKFSSTLLSQLEIHGAGVSTEDANQKFLRSLPSAWSQVSLIMRTKPGVDSLSFDDLYNNLRVFENDVKGSTASSSSTQNVAFVSENTSSTNDVSIAYGVSNPSGQNSQYEHASSYSLLANQSSCPQLDHEDLEQLDEFDLEEMDLKWQVAMISMRMKKLYKKIGGKLQFDAKEPVGSKGNQDGRRRDAWNSGNKDKENGRRSGSDTEVTSCSKECKESYAELKKLYDEQRAQLSDASIEILAYTQALKKVEAQLVAHQQSQLWYEEKIRFMKIDLDDKTDVLTYHKKLLAEAEKEKEDLKAKVEKWHNSSKILSDAPIIEEYESNSEDEHVSLPSEEQETPSFANKQVKTHRETVKNQFTHSKYPKVDKKELGYGFDTKVCFVCGSLSHLIRDCDFHEKRRAKQAELNNRMRKKSSQREIRTIWNNVQRVNHKNQFVPTAVLTRTGKIPVNTARHTARASSTNNVINARHNFNSQAVPTNAAMKVNTLKSIVNNVRPKGDFHKSVLPFRKSLNRTTTLRTNFSYQKVNTTEVNAVSAVRGKRETTVNPSAGCNWRSKRHYWYKISKYNGGSRPRDCANFKDPLGRLKPKKA
ncbi:hypothetical protein Tco_0766060 [Tanacetum coccineum]